MTPSTQKKEAEVICVSLRQPGAWATCAGTRTIENRAAATDYRGELAIHASSSREELRPVLARCRHLGLSESDFACGAVIGTVELAECVALSPELEHDLWAWGPFCWRLRNARLLAHPVPARARPGLFRLDPEIAQQVRDQLQHPQTRDASPIVAKALGDLRPTVLAANLARAAAYLALDQPREVERVTTGILAERPDCGQAYWLRAVGLAAGGQRWQALDDADRAISFGWLEVGQALVRRGNAAAVYHAAECGARRPEEAAHAQAHECHQRLAHLVNVAEPDRALAARCYDAYRRLAPAAAIRAYATTGSASDHHEQLTRLAGDAVAAGLEPAEIDHLRIAALAAQLAHSRPAVMQLTATLEDWFA